MSDYEVSTTVEHLSSRHPDEHDVVEILVWVDDESIGRYYFEDTFMGNIYTYVGFESTRANQTAARYQEKNQLPVAIQELIGQERASKIVTEDGDVLAELDLPGVENDE